MGSDPEIPFAHNAAREACGAIAGYVYQVQVTILRWLGLTVDEELELERGEDIDVIQHHLATGADLRTMEQVKNLAQPVGLRSPSALASLVHFEGHRRANPTHTLRFRYVTTSSVRGERSSPFADRAAGIVVWQGIWSGRIPQDQVAERLSGLRLILRESARPDDIPEEGWTAFRQFVTAASEEALLAFVRAFEWSTDSLPPDEVEREIQRQLQLRKPTASLAEIRDFYFRLFVFVFKILARSGQKQLTPHLLDAEILLSSPRTEDRELFFVVRAMLSSLEERVRGVEGQQAKMLETIAGIAQPFNLARSEIIDPPPLVGKAIPRVDAVKAIQSVLSRATWCALHGESSCGKSQLALLAGNARASILIWIRLRDRSSEDCCGVLDRSLELASGVEHTYLYEQWFAAVCQSLGPYTTIVLDDLPRQIGEPLEVRLLLLGRAAAAAKVSIISTSYDPLASKVKDGLGISLEELTTPGFSDRDITDLLQAFGAQPEQAAALLSIVAAVTRRHAWLARAAAQYLAAKNWILDIGVLDELFRRDFARGIDDQIRRSLLATTTENTRALLNRLLLCDFEFTKEEIDIVAAIEPRIEPPMDYLSPAIGLWVLREGGGTFSASALLHQLGSGTLEDTKARVHLALGKSILKKRKLSPTQGMSAFRHFSAAKDKVNPPLILLRALMALVASRRPVLEDHWGFTLIWIDRALPSYIPLPIRLMLRAYQIIARHRQGRDTEYLFHDLDALMETAATSDSWAVAMAAGLIPLEVGRDYPIRANKYISKMIQLLPMAKSPDGSRIRIPTQTKPESLYWMTASGVKDASALSDWLTTVSRLTPQQRENLFSSELAQLQSLLLCDGIWDRERKKPSNAQDWTSVLKQVQDIASVAELTNNDLLIGCAARARITVLGEFMESPEQALAVALTAYAMVQPKSSAALLICEASARVHALHKQSERAQEWARKAAAADTGDFGLIKRDALLLLSRVLLPIQPLVADELCKNALDLIRRTKDAMAIVQTLGECSVVAWNTSEHEQAFLYLQEAVAILLEENPQKPLWKRLYVLCGHTSGYMASMSQVGQPPTRDYAAPMPGMFLGEGSLDDLYDPNLQGLVPLQLALFSDALGLVADSARWNTTAQNLAKSSGVDNVTADFDWLGVANAINSDDFDSALDLARNAVADRESVTEEQLLRLRISDPKKWLAGVEKLKSADGGSRATLIGTIPIAVHISRSYLADPGQAKALAQRAASACRKSGQSDKHRLTWEKTAALFEKFFTTSDWRELAELGSSLSDENSALANLCYIAVAARAEPLQSLYMQYAIMRYADSNYLKAFRGLYISIFVPFVEAYWRHALKDSGYCFKTPIYTLKRVEEASVLPIASRNRAILKAVSADLGAKPRPETQAWLDSYHG